MKAGLISDIRGNFPAFQATLSALRGNVDVIFFLGDLKGYYPIVDECVELWDKKEIMSVRGNHDQVLLDCLERGEPPGPGYREQFGSALETTWRTASPAARALVRSWPVSRFEQFADISLYLTHGAPWDPLEGRVYPDFMDWSKFDECEGDIILLGHTHYPVAKRWKDRLIVNPGSVGQPRNGCRGACFAILDLPSRTVAHHVAPYAQSSVIDHVTRHDRDLSYLAEVLQR